MTTDWVLIRRAAFELKERLRGARVLDAGLLPDGRIAVTLRRGGDEIGLAVDLFGTPPLVTLEPVELPIAVEPGFVRKLTTTLRGMSVADVRSRRGDRVLRIDFTARSRFGIGDTVELVLELVPRFGNAILIKRGLVVAAAKEFSPSENAARAVMTGHPYVPPPPRANVSPPLDAGPDDAAYEGPPVLELFARMRAERAGQARTSGAQRRRETLQRRLAQREAKLRGELRALDEKRRDAENRDALRLQGDAIFASLHELDEPEREAAKERAAKLFARYKKLASSLKHIDARHAEVARMLEALDVLRWEAERTGDEDLEDVERALSALEVRSTRRGLPAAPEKKRKRRLLEFRTAGGSRIVVGRSPSENADVTFRLARPDDLWFHAQGIPGAHVILARDDRSTPPDEDLETAAALAAFHSKAHASRSIPVDYTLRKYVRKQRDAPPGLVWYTHPKTILAEPITEDALRTLSNPRS